MPPQAGFCALQCSSVDMDEREVRAASRDS